jgi:hypothetical protein
MEREEMSEAREAASPEREQEQAELTSEERRRDEPLAPEERDDVDADEPVSASNGAGPHDDREESEADESEIAPAATEEDEIGNASAAELEKAEPVASSRLEEPTEERRGFLSRIFGRSTDY